MTQPTNEPVEPRTRKPRVTKSSKGQDSKGKVKIAAYVSQESARRLGIHATMTDQDKSTIIDTLIREHLRDWVVQYRPSRGGEEPAREIDAPEV
jgi:hypothetical protein